MLIVDQLQSDLHIMDISDFRFAILSILLEFPSFGVLVVMVPVTTSRRLSIVG